MFERLHHMQLAMPPGQEATARDFYAGVLRMTEIDKPPVLAARVGAWLRTGGVELHLGLGRRLPGRRPQGTPRYRSSATWTRSSTGFGPEGSRTSGTATFQASAGCTRTTRSATASSFSSRRLKTIVERDFGDHPVRGMCVRFRIRQSGRMK